jgi:hypothetical protein
MTLIATNNRQFLERVVVWPGGKDAPGWINLHCHMKNRDPSKNGGKPWVIGWPFKDIDKFISYAKWLETTDQFFDVWYCTSQQSEIGENRAGKPKAVRKRANATWLKAIWIDVDVKDDGKHYATANDAWGAISAFRKKVGLPRPSALVNSGGGLHVYWISHIPLSPDEWRPYAEGLKQLLLAEGIKCDTGLTTDDVRILRVPGTLNHKYDPPRPVQLLHLGADYNFVADLAFLKQVAPAAAGEPAEASREAQIEPGFAAAPDAAFAALSPDSALQAGIEPPKSNALLDPRPIFAQCGFMRHAIATGGKDYDNPLWHLSVLCTTYMANGKVFAHEISNGHATYSPAETQALYDRKVVDRVERDIGYPSCAAIAGAGCKSCATCPLFQKGKSPLNIRAPRAPVTATVTQAETGKAQTGPAEYDPVSSLRRLRDQGADTNVLLSEMNKTYAVVKYGSKIVVASIVGKDVETMTDDHFHKMFANLVVHQETAKGTRCIRVSKEWFLWKERRQYLGRGVVFEPGGPLEIKNDMLNMWRGFGIDPMAGDWKLMRDHIFNVVCSGNQRHFDYLIQWMAYAVQHPEEPMGVAVAFLGAQGAGKGIVARTFGKFFGKHFAHIANGDQLTGRFNASIGTSCVVFLDEALWAADKKGEGVLKALITEPSLQLEAKFRDPIKVENRLRIIVASNNDWAVPAGIGDRRWFVLNVANTYAGTEHRDYWSALYAKIDNGGSAAMLYDLLAMDLTEFNVRAIPHTAAKAHQQVLSLHGTMSWLYHALQEGLNGNGTIGWNQNGFTIAKDTAYELYREFSKQRREWQPEIKDLWAKKIRAALGPHVNEVRPTTVAGNRVRSFAFGPLTECRRRFECYIGASNIGWEPENEPVEQHLNQPEDVSWQPENEPNNCPEDAPVDNEREREDDGLDPADVEREPDGEPAESEPQGTLAAP